MRKHLSQLEISGSNRFGLDNIRHRIDGIYSWGVGVVMSRMVYKQGEEKMYEKQIRRQRIIVKIFMTVAMLFNAGLLYGLITFNFWLMVFSYMGWTPMLIWIIITQNKSNAMVLYDKVEALEKRIVKSNKL